MAGCSLQYNTAINYKLNKWCARWAAGGLAVSIQPHSREEPGSNLRSGTPVCSLPPFSKHRNSRLIENSKLSIGVNVRVNTVAPQDPNAPLNIQFEIYSKCEKKNDFYFHLWIYVMFLLTLHSHHWLRASGITVIWKLVTYLCHLRRMPLHI